MQRRGEHVRQRVAAAASLLHDLWGDALPPGHAPWQRIVADVLDVDDGFGEQHGLAVQGDELDLAVLAELLTYLPNGASLRALLPESLLERMQQSAAVRDPGAQALAIGARVLSVAIRTSGARWAGVYRQEGSSAYLEAALGMTPWERDERRRIRLSGDGPLCNALLRSRTIRGPISVPKTGGGWGGEPALVTAPCIAVPFPSTRRGTAATGALLLVWPVGGDPDPDAVGDLVSPLAAEAEHLLAAAPR